MMEDTIPPPPRDREQEEPRGRWENRCDAVIALDGAVALVCDRFREHRGLHRGRVMELSYGKGRVVAYGAHR